MNEIEKDDKDQDEGESPKSQEELPASPSTEPLPSVSVPATETREANPRVDLKAEMGIKTEAVKESGHKKKGKDKHKRKERRIKRAWEYYRHADNLHAARINFFLVAESMLLVSFATVRGESFSGPFLQLLIPAMGLVYTWIWYHVNKGLQSRMDVLNDDYLRADSVYKRYLAAGQGIPSKVFLTWVLPVATLLLWLILFIVMVVGLLLAYCPK